MSSIGRQYKGPAGLVSEVILEESDYASPALQATIAACFIYAPGQAAAWNHYILAIIHLRDIEGVPPAVIEVPGCTHQVFLYALDPDASPTPDDVSTWRSLRPINLSYQLELPSDEAAKELIDLCAHAVADGILWAEAPLSGQVEPWRSSLLRTAAHLRGEEHAE